jgi:hypothetical protein
MMQKVSRRTGVVTDPPLGSIQSYANQWILLK